MSEAFIMRENELKCDKSQCADCLRYKGDIDCEVFKTTPFDYLGNKKKCPERLTNDKKVSQ